MKYGEPIPDRTPPRFTPVEQVLIVGFAIALFIAIGFLAALSL